MKITLNPIHNQDNTHLKSEDDLFSTNFDDVALTVQQKCGRKSDV